MIFWLCLLLAGAVMFLPAHGLSLASELPLALAFFGAALLWLIVIIIYVLITLRALQNSAAAIPRLLSLAKQNRALQCYILIASMAAAILTLTNLDWLWLGLLPRPIPLAINILCHGAIFTALFRYSQLLSSYLDPYLAVVHLVHAAQKNAAPKKAQEFCHWLAALCEILIRAVSNNQVALASCALQQLNAAMTSFFFPKASADESQCYVLFFGLDRLDYAHSIAVERHFEAFSSELVTALGKLTLCIGKNFTELSPHVIQFIGQWAVRAQMAAMASIGVKSSCLLLEMAREFIETFWQDPAKLTQPLSAIATQMANIARARFRCDKSISIATITAPLNDLQQLITQKFPTHTEATAAVTLVITNALEEFSALQAALRTLPIPSK